MALMLVVMVMVMVVMLVLLVFVMVMVLVAGAVGVMALVLVVVVMMLVMVGKLLQLVGESIGTLYGLEDLGAGKIVPGGGYDKGFGVALAEKLHGSGELCLAQALGAAEHDGTGVLHLVIIKLAEIFHIHFAFACIANCGGGGYAEALNAGNGLDYIAELANTGGLYEYAVGGVFLHDLLQRGGEVAHKGAADAAGVQLVHLNTGFLHKASVNAYLAELVFDEDDFLSRIGFGNELFYKGGFSGAEETGKNINFCHIETLSFSVVFL